MEAAVKTGNMIMFSAGVLNYPGRSEDVFTTRALIEVGLGEDVERKF